MVITLLGGVLKMRRPRFKNQFARCGHSFLSVLKTLLRLSRLTRWLTDRIYFYALCDMSEPVGSGWATKRCHHECRFPHPNVLLNGNPAVTENRGDY